MSAKPVTVYPFCISEDSDKEAVIICTTSQSGEVSIDIALMEED